MPRATFKLFRGRSSNPIGTASFFGRSHKAANATGGLRWIQKGGGYWSECNKKLKA